MIQRPGFSLIVALLTASGGIAPAFAEDAAEIEAQARQHFALAEQYRNSKLWENAAVEYEKGLKLLPDNHDAYARLGYVLTEAGRYDDAVRVLGEFIEKEPGVCRGYDSLGYVFMRQAQAAEESDAELEAAMLEEAIAAYGRGIEQCPDDADLQYSIARAYLKAEDREATIAALTRLTDITPNDARAYELIAEQHYQVKEYAQAIEAYEKLLALPSHGKSTEWVRWAAARIAAMYRRSEMYAEAVPYYEQVLEGNPEDMRALEGIAVSLEKTGRTEPAVDAYEKLIQAQPDKATYYYSLGQLLHDLGQYQKAVSRIKRGLRYEMDCSAKAHYLLGESQEKLENFQAAKREFERARDCGDPVFTEKAIAQIERQTQLIKIEKAKRELEAEG